jgi:gamma-glutamylcyclotransferase
VPRRLSLLYFAYGADIHPDVISERCPNYRFRFVAHLPEHKLVFPLTSPDWGGGVASVEPTQGETVWGVIYELSDAQMKALASVHATEGRDTRSKIEVMDREGKRHQAVTYRAKNNSVRHRPSRKFIDTVVAGSRKWELPAGWIAGVEELAEN